MSDEQDPPPPEPAAPENDALTQLRDELVRLGAENAELKDKALRALAEAENTRRRAERDRGDYQKYAVTSFARDILPVADNMRRAIEALGNELGEGSPQAGLLSGIEATERELIAVLERNGVRRFEPAGERFDPHRHDAMSQIEMPGVAPDTIIHVVQAGYTIGERILRPAAVVVAKGGLPGVTPPAGETLPPVSGAAGPAAAAQSTEPDIVAMLRPCLAADRAAPDAGIARTVLGGEVIGSRPARPGGKATPTGRSGLGRTVLHGQPPK